MSERRLKYNAKPIEFDGIRFDSQAEARRYRELILLEKSGAIWGLAVHPRFELRPAATYNGVRWRAVTYVGDFEYYEDNGSRPPVHVVEDVKGVETAVFRLKRRLFAEAYPDIKFVVVKV